MSGSLNIFPFENAEGLVRFGVQCGVFLVGYIVIKQFVVKPLFSLSAERHRRTGGRLAEIEKLKKDVSLLEADYNNQLKKIYIELGELKLKEFKEVDKITQDMVSESKRGAELLLKEAAVALLAEKTELKKSVGDQVKELSLGIVKKVTAMTILLALSFTLSDSVFAEDLLGEDFNSSSTFWPSVFWPYYQFILYIMIMVYFGRKPIKNLLETRRDNYRAKLAESMESYEAVKIKLESIQKKLEEFPALTHELRAAALTEIEQNRNSMVSDAKHHAEFILHEAKRTAEDKIQSAIQDLKKELIEKSILEAEHEVKVAPNLKQMGQCLKDSMLSTITEKKVS